MNCSCKNNFQIPFSCSSSHLFVYLIKIKTIINSFVMNTFYKNFLQLYSPVQNIVKIFYFIILY